MLFEGLRLLLSLLRLFRRSAAAAVLLLLLLLLRGRRRRGVGRRPLSFRRQKRIRGVGRNKSAAGGATAAASAATAAAASAGRGRRGSRRFQTLYLVLQRHNLFGVHGLQLILGRRTSFDNFQRRHPA